MKNLRSNALDKIVPKVIQQRIITQTVQGEVTINLNLTITINQDGSVEIATNKPIEKQEEKVNSIFAIPEFEATEFLSNFGEDAEVCK